MSDEQLRIAGGAVNRVHHLARDYRTTALMPKGAFQKLASISTEIRSHDYVVLDLVLESEVEDVMTEILLSSTVWFDASNGQVFLAHHDDGLVHDIFYDLGQVRRIGINGKNKVDFNHNLE